MSGRRSLDDWGRFLTTLGGIITMLFLLSCLIGCAACAVYSVAS